jgi:LmbE family N-acetylglucosaminyl deacetylase
MKKKKIRVIACAVIAGIFFWFSFVFSAWSQDISTMPPFTKKDRVLILAPHPDDESIGAAGSIQRALRVGAKVKVVCYTNGDANELSFILYEKRLTFFKKTFLYMGEVRRKETLAAMKVLGVDPTQMTFLGYPDHGTMAILTRYWGTVKPYRSIFARVTQVSYPDALTYHAPYVGESILSDLEKVLLDFRPTKIIVSNPVDTNRDHRSLYIFLRVALWDLEKKIGRPQVYPYLIHVVDWPKPRGYEPQLRLDPPSKYVGMRWTQQTLTQEEVEKKRDAISQYKSQLTYAPGYLYSFARSDELFGDYPALVLKRQVGPDLKWQDIGINISKDEEGLFSLEKDDDSDGEDGAPQRTTVSDPDKISYLAFARHDENLWVKVVLNKKIDKTLGLSMYLLGYSKKTDFSVLPKLHISLGTFGVKVLDKQKRLRDNGVQVITKNRTFVVKVPLKDLGDPDRIFSSARVVGFPYETTAWRILELDPSFETASQPYR